MITRLGRGMAAPVSAAFILLGTGSCRCGNTGQGDGGNLGELDNVLSALCGYLSRCPQASPYPIAYRSQDECVQILQFLITCHLTVTQDPRGESIFGVQQSVPSIDPTQGQACIDWLNQASCAALLGGCDGGSSCASPCASINFFGGGGKTVALPVGLDQRCDRAQCDTGLYCEQSYAVDGGTTCQVCKPDRAAGGDCGDPPHVPCGPGLYCPSNGSCASLFAAGTACNGGYLCASTFCNPNTNVCDSGGNPGDPCTNAKDCRVGFCDSTSHCANPLANGAPCTDNSQCEYFYCDTTSGRCGGANGVRCSGDSECQGYCNTSVSPATCAAKLALGQPCNYDSQCLSNFCDSFSSRTCVNGCHTNSDCQATEYCDFQSQTCLAKAANGSSCSPGDGSSCQSGFCTVAGTCQTKPGIGDPCSQTFDCMPQGYCSNGKCAALLQPDQACTDIQSCEAPFLCLKGKCTLMPLTCAPGAQGSTCTLLEVCDDSSRCDLANNFTCAPRVAAGSSCIFDADCQAGLYCPQGTCTSYAQAGESCSFSNVCGPGLLCDSSTNVCVAPKPGGAPCNNNSDCASGVCNFSGSGNVCQAPCVMPPPGEVPACHPSQCPSNLNCDSVDDGCGGFATCGSAGGNCTGYDTCGGSGSPNICGCTPSGTCLPRQCSVDIKDGCGQFIFCDAGCATGTTCGGGGSGAVCGCPTNSPDGGWTLPTAGYDQRDGGGTAIWYTPSLAYGGDDGGGAATSMLGGTITETSDNLVVSGFGFNLPPTATVNGIEVTVRRYATDFVESDQVILMSGGRGLGSKQGGFDTWTKNWATATYGSDGDLWGYPWTTAQINSPDFSVGINVTSSHSGQGFVDCFVDDVWVKIDYCVPP